MKQVKDFTDLVGHTITSIRDTSDSLDFTLANGQKCSLYHEQDCCESVSIDDISGDFSLLLDSPLLSVSEEESNENPPGVAKGWQDSFTWTTYVFTTAKGSVTVRWYGESNGYYSEHVNFCVNNK